MHATHSKPVTLYRDWSAGMSPKEKLRSAARDALIFGLSLKSRVPRNANWLRFPYYHHVFDDERASFDAHLRYMRKFGEIISLDDAVGMLSAADPIDGRYFCLTFDDGFKNCLTNALPILLEHEAKAAFFIATSFIGTSVERDRERLMDFYGHGRILMEFLDWDDCRQLAAAGMTIGSHTVSHRVLAKLSAAEAEVELRESKKKVEEELETACHHFCAPVGRPGVDFLEERDYDLARKVGYRSFLTTQRGSVHRKSTPMAVERDHTLADWGLYQLRYFFSQ